MADNLQVSRDLLFVGDDLNRDRMAVEREKMRRRFPRFAFLGVGATITAVEGPLRTNEGTRYTVRIEVPGSYPYSIPTVRAKTGSIKQSCPHVYADGSLCLMRSAQWSSTYSLAFLVVKTAVWLNKYDRWIATGRWPGRDQHRG